MNEKLTLKKKKKKKFTSRIKMFYPKTKKQQHENEHNLKNKGRKKIGHIT